MTEKRAERTDTVTAFVRAEKAVTYDKILEASLAYYNNEDTEIQKHITWLEAEIAKTGSASLKKELSRTLNSRTTLQADMAKSPEMIAEMLADRAKKAAKINIVLPTEEDMEMVNTSLDFSPDAPLNKNRKIVSSFIETTPGIALEKLKVKNASKAIEGEARVLEDEEVKEDTVESPTEDDPKSEPKVVKFAPYLKERNRRGRAKNAAKRPLNTALKVGALVVGLISAACGGNSAASTVSAAPVSSAASAAASAESSAAASADSSPTPTDNAWGSNGETQKLNGDARGNSKQPEAPTDGSTKPGISVKLVFDDIYSKYGDAWTFNSGVTSGRMAPAQSAEEAYAQLTYKTADDQAWRLQQSLPFNAQDLVGKDPSQVVLVHDTLDKVENDLANLKDSPLTLAKFEAEFGKLIPGKQLQMNFWNTDAGTMSWRTVTLVDGPTNADANQYSVHDLANIVYDPETGEFTLMFNNCDNLFRPIPVVVAPVVHVVPKAPRSVETKPNKPETPAASTPAAPASPAPSISITNTNTNTNTNTVNVPPAPSSPPSSLPGQPVERTSPETVRSPQTIPSPLGQTTAPTTEQNAANAAATQAKIDSLNNTEAEKNQIAAQSGLSNNTDPVSAAGAAPALGARNPIETSPQAVASPNVSPNTSTSTSSMNRVGPQQ